MPILRRPATLDLSIQIILAVLILLPLLLGFIGKGSFEDVYGRLNITGREITAPKRDELFAALGRSGWIGLGSCGIAMLIGLPAAWALSRKKISPFKLALCALPLALAPSAAVSGWLYWMAPEGVASAFRLVPDQIRGPGPLFSVSGVCLILGFSLWPIVAFEVWPAFARARGDGWSSALLTGSPSRAFFRIVLPLCAGELAAGGLLVYLLAASDFTVSSLLLVRTLPIHVHEFLSLDQPASAAWAALPLALLSTVVAVLLTRVRRHVWTSEALVEKSEVHTGGSWIMDLFLYGGILVGFCVPMIGCSVGAFSGGHSFGQALQPGLTHLIDSLRLAAAAGILAVVCGAARAAVWPDVRANTLHAAALMALVVPGSFLAAGLLTADLFRKDMFDWLGQVGQFMNNMIPPELALVLGYALRFVYLPLRLTEEGLRAMDPALLEAAELAGHEKLHRGLGVAVPMVWRYLLAGGVLVFVLTLGELPVAAKLAPPGVMPASVWLFGRQHQGYTEEVFALSTMIGVSAIVALVVVGMLVGWMMTGRKKRMG